MYRGCTQGSSNRDGGQSMDVDIGQQNHSNLRAKKVRTKQGMSFEHQYYCKISFSCTLSVKASVLVSFSSLKLLEPRGWLPPTFISWCRASTNAREIAQPDVSAVHKCIRTRLENARDDEIRSVFDLAIVIMDQCSRVFFDRTLPADQQPLVMDSFANAIGKVVRFQLHS